jgi:hypothetical protein
MNDHFRQILAETIAWCSWAGRSDDPLHSLRTPAFEPAPFSSDDELWAKINSGLRTSTDNAKIDELIAKSRSISWPTAEYASIVDLLAKRRRDLLQSQGHYHTCRILASLNAN